MAAGVVDTGSLRFMTMRALRGSIGKEAQLGHCG
jgi:hypothetical protein